MMDHRQYIEQYLSADVDGALSPTERQAVAAHLAACADCRLRQADERALKALLRERIPIVSAPAELRQQIIAALDAETARPASAPARRAQVGLVRFTRRPLWMGSFAALAAAAVVIAVIMVRGLGQQSMRPNAFGSAIKEYVVSERNFASNPALSSPMEFASALALEFGYPYIWDFSPLGLIWWAPGSIVCPTAKRSLTGSTRDRAGPSSVSTSASSPSCYLRLSGP